MLLIIFIWPVTEALYLCSVPIEGGHPPLSFELFSFPLSLCITDQVTEERNLGVQRGNNNNN